jgi:hypothetical protein
MPDRGDAKPLRARDGRALNPTRGVAENGRPLVNTNCPTNIKIKEEIDNKYKIKDILDTNKISTKPYYLVK